MDLLNVRGNGNLGINGRLEGRMLPAIQSKAYSSFFDYSVREWEKVGSFDVEGNERRLSKLSTIMPHQVLYPSRCP